MTVDTSTTFQTWRAWRATVSVGVKIGPGCAAISQSLLDQLLDDAVNDLGLNGLRQEQLRQQSLETTNDNADPNVIVQSAFNTGFQSPWTGLDGCNNLPHVDSIPKILVPFRARVLANGEPFEMYVSFVEYGNLSNMPPWWGSNPDEAAEAMHAYAVWFNSNWGFYPNYFTWNEPDSSHGTSRWAGNWAKNLGDRLAAAGIPSRVELPSVANPNDTVGFFDNALGVSGAITHIKRITYHSYDYSDDWPGSAGVTVRNNIRQRALDNNIDSGMTEIWRSDWHGEYTVQGKRMARDIWLNMIEGRISTWEPLGLMFLCNESGVRGCNVPANSNADLINLEVDLSQYYKLAHYYVLRQYSRYIRPGYVRVAHTCTSCGSSGPEGTASIKPVAFRRANGTVVVVILNDTASPQTVTLNGLPNGNYTIHRLDPTMCSATGGRDRCTPTSSTFSGASTTLSMPADAVWAVVQSP